MRRHFNDVDGQPRCNHNEQHRYQADREHDCHYSRYDLVDRGLTKFLRDKAPRRGVLMRPDGFVRLDEIIDVLSTELGFLVTPDDIFDVSFAMIDQLSNPNPLLRTQMPNFH